MIASRTLLAVGMAAAILGPSTARAAVIQGLFNTGVDANGVALVGGDGVVDPHYLIVDSTTPELVGLQAVTYRHPAYLIDDADSRWVSQSATGGPGNNVTTYRLAFSLDGLDPTTARITGRWGADNFISLIINGVSSGLTSTGWGGLSSFTLASGFVTGVNHLDFQVTDAGQPTGFRIDDLAGTAELATPPVGGVPEPATWAMMLTGFFGMGGVLRSRRRWASALA